MLTSILPVNIVEQNHPIEITNSWFLLDKHRHQNRLAVAVNRILNESTHSTSHSIVPDAGHLSMLVQN